MLTRLQAHIRHVRLKASCTAAAIVVALMLSAPSVDALDRPDKEPAGVGASAALPSMLKLVKKGKDSNRYIDVRSGAMIIVSEGYALVEGLPNDSVAYDFGIRHKTDKYEVRVRFDHPKDVNVAALGEQWAMVIRMNLNATELMSPFVAMPQAAVKKEFNGDWGIVAKSFEIKAHDPAWKVYKLCLIEQFYKYGIGAYTLFRCSDSREILYKHILNTEAYHVFKFAPDAPGPTK